MATIDEIKKSRLSKLKTMEKDGLVYPGKTRRNITINEALKQFSALSRAKKEIIIAGRIRAIRGHGKASFLNIEDGEGSMQILFREDRLGENKYRYFIDNFDIGDFVEVRGILMKTKRGEKTIEGTSFKMLAKSLLPLPEKWHGLTDTEERYRKRYLDLIFNKEVKNKFILRSKIISAIRDFLDKDGSIEVETPILQSIYGGARAKPFKTHLNALDIDLFLRIAPELYLKRLIVGGYEKVYEIGRCFRNEGMDKFHNPDFTMIEFYWAYADYKDLMKLVEKMLSMVIKKTFGGLKIKHQEDILNFKTPWPRVEFTTVFRKETGIDYDAINDEGLIKKAKELGVEVEKGASKAAVADEIFKKFCRPKIIQPTFLIHYPIGFQTLAKALDDNPNRLANFQLVVNGAELTNAFSELNNPLEQRARFEEQQELRKKGFDEAHEMDEDFVEALEYGMPPTAGFGMGIDRLVTILTNSYSLREVILFPTMRPKE
ncbi:MAG: lysine--tRNA ligase [bacterium]